MAAYDVSEVEVWAGDIPNRPGTLARVLEALSDAGAELEFMIARPVDENTSRVFVAPIKGNKRKQAAQSAGLSPAQGLHSLRVEGPDRPGLGTDITKAIAGDGINLRGASAAGVGKRAVFYIAIDSPDAVKPARRAVKDALAGKKGGKKKKKRA